MIVERIEWLLNVNEEQLLQKSFFYCNTFSGLEGVCFLCKQRTMTYVPSLCLPLENVKNKNGGNQWLKKMKRNKIKSNGWKEKSGEKE